MTRLRAFSRAFCKLCAYLLWVFTCVWSVVALVYAFQYQLSYTSLRPLFGIVLANPCARTPFVLWVTDMIWAVYLMFRVANYKAPYKRSRWPLLHSTAPQMPTLRLFEKMNLNKNLKLKKAITELLRLQSSQYFIALIVEPALSCKNGCDTTALHSSGQPQELLLTIEILEIE